MLVELCNWLYITIIEGAVCSDHVHMYLFGSTQTFSIACHEDSQREKCRAIERRIPATAEAILGNAHLGKLRAWGWLYGFSRMDLCHAGCKDSVADQFRQLWNELGFSQPAFEILPKRNPKLATGFL